MEELTQLETGEISMPVSQDQLTWKEKRNKKKKNDFKRFTKKKFPLGRIILVIIILCIGAFVYIKMTQKGPSGIPVGMLPLEKGGLTSSINLTGVIESANDASVYAKASGLIESVNVKVGDQVKAGQVLARLDTRDAELDIAQKEAQIAQTKRLQEFALESTEKGFDAGRVDVAAGLNSELTSAENAVDRAQKELNAARHDFNDSRENQEVADIMFKKAQKKLEKASDDYWQAKLALEEAGANPPQSVKDAYEAASKNLEDEKDAYNAVDREYAKEMSSEAKAYRDARSDYEKALKSRDIAKNAVARELDKLKDNVEKAELDIDFTSDYLAIEQLQRKIGDSVVIAPISGTITAVDAKEGASASGQLFLIEDTENLVVKTAVKELDIAKIKPEMKADVKADATGDNVFPATVQTINPTAKKDENGKTKTTGSVEFETDITLDQPEPSLRVGMNVRVNIVTEEQKDILYVPFDAVSSDADGNSLIYIAEMDAEGILRAKEISVKTGMETDFYIAVSGDGLKDGALVISDPSMVQDGVEVRDMNAVSTVVPDNSSTSSGVSDASGSDSSISSNSGSESSVDSSAAQEGSSQDTSDEKSSDASASDTSSESEAGK